VPALGHFKKQVRPLREKTKEGGGKERVTLHHGVLKLS